MCKDCLIFAAKISKQVALKGLLKPRADLTSPRDLSEKTPQVGDMGSRLPQISEVLPQGHATVTSSRMCPADGADQGMQPYIHGFGGLYKLISDCWNTNN